MSATYWSMMLARDIGTCEALLRGEAISHERVHRDWLEFASEFRLVRLDLRAIDLLGRRVDLHRLLQETR